MFVQSDHDYIIMCIQIYLLKIWKWPRNGIYHFGSCRMNSVLDSMPMEHLYAYR